MEDLSPLNLLLGYQHTSFTNLVHEPAMELFVTMDQQWSVLAYPPGSSHLLIGSTHPALHAPIALDKKTRYVFYISKQQQGYKVIKTDIDNPAEQHTVILNKLCQLII